MNLKDAAANLESGAPGRHPAFPTPGVKMMMRSGSYTIPWNIPVRK